MNKKGSLIIVSGPSGVGKGTLLNLYVGQNESSIISISHTTRKPRSGEVDGVHYKFVSREKFETMIASDDFMEYADYNGNYYGTSKKMVKKALSSGTDVILEIDLQGALQLKEKYPNHLYVFIMPPSKAILKERLIGRNTDITADIQKRLDAAEHEIANAYVYDNVIINDNLEEALLEFTAVVTAYPTTAKVMKKFIDEVNDYA